MDADYKLKLGRLFIDNSNATSLLNENSSTQAVVQPGSVGLELPEAMRNNLLKTIAEGLNADGIENVSHGIDLISLEKD